MKEQIEYLQTLPQDLEIWHEWDESGECFPTPKPRGYVTRVHEVERRRGTRWEEDDSAQYDEDHLPGPGSKKVVMI